MSQDPLVDVRSREDARENYLDGLTSVSEHETPRARLARPSAPEPKSLGSGSCWCGASYGHDWPDRANGAPHPRSET
jgi:hypothetical protein